jgi:protein-arginine kinase activator protein McsA
MTKSAKAFEFEKAASLRDRIAHLRGELADPSDGEKAS